MGAGRWQVSWTADGHERRRSVLAHVLIPSRSGVAVKANSEVAVRAGSSEGTGDDLQGLVVRAIRVPNRRSRRAQRRSHFVLPVGLKTPNVAGQS